MAKQFVKVELQDVLINGYGRGSVLEMEQKTAERLQAEGYVKILSEDKPLLLVKTPFKIGTPQINLSGTDIRTRESSNLLGG